MAKSEKALHIGEWEIISIDDTPGEFPPTVFEGPLSAEDRAGYFANGVAQNSTNVFVVKGNNHVILIDAGYGKNLFDSLSSLGIQIEDIDIILVTHAHPDHITGLIKEGTPVFTKASIYISVYEYAAFMKSDSFGNILNKVSVAYKSLNTIVHDEVVIPGIKCINLSGHTVGHVGFEVVGNDASKILIAGDFVHATDLQFAHPDENFVYDADKPKAVATRRWLLEKAAAEKFLVAGSHIVCPGIGRVKKIDGGEFNFIPF